MIYAYAAVRPHGPLTLVGEPLRYRRAPILWPSLRCAAPAPCVCKPRTALSAWAG